jgi:hypothetical protein
MLYKKPSPKQPELQKSSSKGKVLSPQKQLQSRFSPMKRVSKPPQQSSRNYFNYTPLRQNKSLTCSTPDLMMNRSMKKEASEISSQRKVLLDQGKMLHEKLKEFKTKIKANASNSFTSRSNYSQTSLFCKLLEKKLLKRKTSSLKFAFSLIKLTFNQWTRRFTEIYSKKIMQKAFKGLKEVAKLMKHASDHYKLQLLVKTFTKWNESMTWRRSSSETNESTVEDKDSTPALNSSSDEDDSDLMYIADSFYKSSLKLYKGIVPWKKFLLQKRKQRKSQKLANENFLISLKIKAFSALMKNRLNMTEKPRNFYKITQVQKYFNLLKNFQATNEEVEIKIARFRKVMNN